MRLVQIGIVILAGLLGVVIGILLAGPGDSDGRQTPAVAMSDEAFAARVRMTMVSEPEILRDAFAALEAQTRDAEIMALQDAVTRNYSLLESAPATFIEGNPDGDITIIEFFDYECGFCRRAAEPFRQMIEADGNIRVVYFEMPILGERSYRAALAAVAAERQGLYEPFHDAMVDFAGQLTDEAIFEIAAEVGLDVEQLAADVQLPEITERVNANVQFADSLSLFSTPTYVVGGQVQLGFNEDRMMAAIGQARER